MKDIIIIGSGGIGREVAWIIEEINEVTNQWNILGFVDDNTEMWDKELNGYKVLGGIEYLKQLGVKPYVVIGIANCQVKKNIVAKLNREFQFATIVHPSVRVSKYIEIGKGTIIYPNVILTVNTVIKDYVIISGNCGIGHDSVIGNYSSVLWGCNLSGYDVVGDECLVGIGTLITQGKQVDDGENVLAGTVI